MDTQSPRDMQSPDMSLTPTTARELTFWEKAVWLTFNPGWNPQVTDIKTLYAKIIDNLNESRKTVWPGEKGRLLSVAITEAQTAQMWAVKAVTWND